MFDTFYSCSGLSSIIIPNSVTEIKDNAFGACPNLTSVYDYATTPQLITDIVFSNAKNCTLYVPKWYKSNYSIYIYWRQFKEMLEMEATNIENVNVNEIGIEYTQYYQVNGIREDGLQKGLNLVKTKDGVRKVIVK